jgi:hypothetical protein
MAPYACLTRLFRCYMVTQWRYIYVCRWDGRLPSNFKRINYTNSRSPYSRFQCITIHKILGYLIDLVWSSVIAIYLVPSVDSNIIGQSSCDHHIYR